MAQIYLFGIGAMISAELRAESSILTHYFKGKERTIQSDRGKFFCMDLGEVERGQLIAFLSQIGRTAEFCRVIYKTEYPINHEGKSNVVNTIVEVALFQAVDLH